MTRLTLDNAAAIITGALAHGRELALKPLSVAVLDARYSERIFRGVDAVRDGAFQVSNLCDQ